MFTTTGIIRDIIPIIMEACPKEVDVPKLRMELSDNDKVDGVIAIHDLHIWSIKKGKIALSVHIETNKHDICETLEAA